MALSSTERQRAYRERMIASGLTPVTIYVPSDMPAMFRSLEAMFKKNTRIEGLVVRDGTTGRVKTLRVE